MSEAYINDATRVPGLVIEIKISKGAHFDEYDPGYTEEEWEQVMTNFCTEMLFWPKRKDGLVPLGSMYPNIKIALFDE